MQVAQEPFRNKAIGAANHAHLMPCWKMDRRLVLLISRSAHCTMTMEVKKAVWQVYSTTFRWPEVCNILEENLKRDS